MSLSASRPVSRTATALRIPARGMPSPVAGGEPGDGFVIVRAEPDPRFIRCGPDRGP